MRTISVNCPNCGASINLDVDHLAHYCGSCGSKIMLDISSIQELLVAREKTKQETIKATELTKQVQVDAAKEIKIEQIRSENSNRYLQQKDVSDKRSFAIERTAMGIAVFFIVFAVVAGVILYASLEKSINRGRELHNERIATLQQIEIDIEKDIENGNYDHALLLANRLRLDDNWSSDETKEWDERREEYIRIINQHIQQSNQK